LKTIAAANGAMHAVALTEEQLAADVENIVATMGLRPDWPNLGVISLAHSYGFSSLVLPLLLHGIPLILVPSALPEVARRAAQSHPKVTLPAVPALWRGWHAAGAIPPNVVLGISAGAPLPLALERAVFAAQGLKIHNFLGASECGGISYDPTLVPREDEACVGHLLKNVEAGVNADGVLVVRSRAVGETYWPNPSEKLGGGCFQTDDLADLKDDLVYLRGRVDDQMNVAGRKIFPTVIEQALRQHASVMECLVFGVPDKTAGRTDVIVACVAPREKGDAAQLRQFLLGKLPGWQVPREWWFVKSLDANKHGKVSRAEWRGKFLELRALGSAEGPYQPKIEGLPEEVVFRHRTGKKA
jgi:acyl-CoA synthetase (AMP-forming)/AMP-acid ligase II